MAQAPPFRTLGGRYNLEDLAESLTEGISVGHPKMPVVEYSPIQTSRIIAYLKGLQPLRPTVQAR